MDVTVNISYAARIALERFFDWAADIEVPEVTRLATTIDPWCVELLAYFRTGDASTGPVEATKGEIEAIGRIALGFRHTNNFRTRMLLNTAVARHTPTTPRLWGRRAQEHPSPPSSSGRAALVHHGE